MSAYCDRCVVAPYKIIENSALLIFDSQLVPTRAALFDFEVIFDIINTLRSKKNLGKVR
ncbi:hypothetical protein ES702_00448 [subsurface metagenome]